MKLLKNIIFSGGGFKCWAYIGTIRALNENVPFDKIKKIIGVSCGSIFSLFYILQIEYSYILEFFLNFNIKKYIDIDIDSVIINQSVLEGKRFKSLIMDLMSVKVNPEITFSELYETLPILYTVLSFNVSDIKIEYFNKNNTPDIKVIDALMASCALPFLFPAYIINDKVYYDVGFCNNCPCNLIDYEEQENNTIALDLSNYKVQEKYNIMTLFYCMMDMLNKHYNKINKKITYKIVDHRFKAEFMNLRQSKDTIFNVYMNGYTNSKKALTSFFKEL
jgi:NTE family protein